MSLFDSTDQFVNRHIGVNSNDISEMCKTIRVNSLDDLIDKTIPSGIRTSQKLELNKPLSEYDFLIRLKEIANKNEIFKSFIGLGYYGTKTPSVILRNILENPGWYTAYTPYQAEISQGRLEALLNFQTMIVDMTGLPIANASLLDEGTAAAEAMTMLFAAKKPGKKNADTFFVSQDCFPQTINVLKTRSKPFGIKILVGDHTKVELDENIFGVLVQYPNAFGEVVDYSDYFKQAASKDIYKVVAADLMSLALLTPPGEFDADVVVGSSQRFGVPMGFGGPHAAFFATKDEFKRKMPGRIIGVSVDVYGRKAYRMALQTREQHIKREKATSNICTSQVLLAVIAAMYAVYHGQNGIKAIAEKIHDLTKLLNGGLKKLGLNQVNINFFDTLSIKIDDEDLIERIKTETAKRKINLNFSYKNIVGISLDEISEFDDVDTLLYSFAVAMGKADEPLDLDSSELKFSAIPQNLTRQTEYLTHPVFSLYHTETELMRYLRRLENKDISLTHSMISLGSCTMKLNAATEMLGITWPEFSQLHPFVPEDQAAGYMELFNGLEDALCKITGFSAVSLQPNSGAQGEYTGLMVIKAYHENKGDHHRDVVLIPSSAHGTNPASAVMAGDKVVIIKCDNNGNIDLEDLKQKAVQYKDNLCALMVTYPSTHGVFEEEIVEICRIIHDNGGLVYMDGANMNAQVGLTSPFIIGADVCHLNLHKTFAIPHGGGGPGVGPIAVAEHLVPFLPGHSVVNINREKSITAVSSAPWGSASVLPISFAYITMMGGEGLTLATKAAILNANYLKAKLEPYYKVLYTGKNGTVAHELIFDMHEFKASANVEVEDIAKRLMDYGYHAPTVSFPVHGTLMVEPTESESKAELDKFCNAMISIRKEIDEIVEGKFDKSDNVFKNAPHTSIDVTADNWNHSYSREKAAYPVPYLRENKIWATVGRIDNAYGDRNLICACTPVSDYLKGEE
ncbi:MAG: aminomethyl-transferring glycine dehydrogenase [bacterium]